MTTTTIELRKLAEAATPGPWATRMDDAITVRDNQDNQLLICTHLKSRMGGRRATGEVEITAKYIATANPTKVIELLDTIEAQAKQIEVLQSAEKTLLQLGYTNEGGEYWKPPIGKAPNFDLVDVWRTKNELVRALENLLFAASIQSKDPQPWRDARQDAVDALTNAKAAQPEAKQ